MVAEVTSETAAPDDFSPEFLQKVLDSLQQELMIAGLAGAQVSLTPYTVTAEAPAGRYERATGYRIEIVPRAVVERELRDGPPVKTEVRDGE